MHGHRRTARHEPTDTGCSIDHSHGRRPRQVDIEQAIEEASIIDYVDDTEATDEWEEAIKVLEGSSFRQR